MWRVPFFLLSAALAGAWGQTAPRGLTRADAYRTAQALTELGRQMFFDPGLSESGRISCASCHDPAFAYGSPNGLAVQRGGAEMQQGGRRAVPSLRYLQVVPQFTEHYFDSAATGDDSLDAGPTGGLTWDGRADRLRDQAANPLLSPFEMANPSAASVVEKVERASYAGQLRRLAPGRDKAALFATFLDALQAWQQDYREFYPYSSKYDRWLAGKAELTSAERNGLRLFSAPEKGNCARCHIAERGANGTPPQFTDYSLVALGAPRNREIPANADAGWYDLGLCGPERTDLRDREEYCGRFMTPTLRNVAVRQAFFHNGVFHSLKEAVEFYAGRDTNPGKWYPRRADGTVSKFDDLPSKYHGNVEREPPFGGDAGEKPSLSDPEIADIVAFLETLTDADIHVGAGVQR